VGFGYLDFSFGRLHALLLETVGQYDHRMAIKEAEYSIDVRTELDSALPDFLRADQLLEIGGRDHVQVFQEPEHPKHLLGYLARQRIKKFLDGASPIRCLVEEDGSTHGKMLTCELTYVKKKVNVPRSGEILALEQAVVGMTDHDVEGQSLGEVAELFPVRRADEGVQIVPARPSRF